MDDKADSALQHVKPSVTRALIFVCDKCGKKLDEIDGDRPSRALASALKHEAKARFGKGEIRAMTSSCLDICPKERVTVCINNLTTGATQFMVVKPKKLDQVVAQILDSEILR
jgi:predicted metal-binding protein